MDSYASYDTELMDRPIQADSDQSAYPNRNTGQILPEYTNYSLNGVPYLGSVNKQYVGWDRTPVYFTGPTRELGNGVFKLKFHPVPILAVSPPKLVQDEFIIPDPWLDPQQAAILSGGMSSAMVGAAPSPNFQGRPAPGIPSSSVFAGDEIFRYYSLKSMGVEIPKPQSVVSMEREARLREPIQMSDIAADAPTDVPLDLTAGNRTQQEIDALNSQEFAQLEVDFKNVMAMQITEWIIDGTLSEDQYNQIETELLQSTREALIVLKIDPSIADRWIAELKSGLVPQEAPATVQLEDPAQGSSSTTASTALVPPVTPVTPVTPVFPDGELQLKGLAATNRIQDNLEYARSLVYEGLTKEQKIGLISSKLNVSKSAVKSTYSVLFPSDSSADPKPPATEPRRSKPTM